jgi:small nuclear ribonucleoprotein (snRNP)-like protein
MAMREARERLNQITETAWTGWLCSYKSHSSLMTVSGILKGFDQLVNLVLDESKETIRGTCMGRGDGRLITSRMPSGWGPSFTCACLYEMRFHLQRPLSLCLSDPNDPYRLTEETRDLGLCICRGTQVRGTLTLSNDQCC